jgi:hypothetical protein
MEKHASQVQRPNRVRHVTIKQLAVLKFIRDRGASGATDKQIQSGLSMCGDTQRPRRRELEQAGLIREADHTRNGLKVWLAVDLETSRPAERSEPIGKSPISSATTIGPIRQRQLEAARRAAEDLNAAFGGRLDDMSPAEVGDLIEMADEMSRDGLRRRFEKLGTKSGFVRPQLLRLLQHLEDMKALE